MYPESQKITQAPATPPLWPQCVCRSRSGINSTGELAEFLKLKGTHFSLNPGALLDGHVICGLNEKQGRCPPSLLLLLLLHIALLQDL